MSTAFDEIRPIVEGRLYEWGRYASDRPQAAISSAYRPDTPGPVDSKRRTPQPEEWTERHWNAIEVSKIVEEAMERLSREQKAVIELRYRHRRPWHKIASDLHVSRRTAYKIRDEALVIVAYELGLLNGSSDGNKR